MDEPNPDPQPSHPETTPPALPAEGRPTFRPENDVPAPEPADGVPVLQPVWPPDFPPAASPSHVGFWLALAVGGLAFVGMLVAGGEARRFALNGFELLPFLGLTLFAYAGERNESMRLATILYWFLLVGLVALLSLLLTVGAVVDPAALRAVKPGPPAGGPPPPLVLPGGAGRLFAAVLGIGLAVGLGVFGYLPRARLAAARRLPFDPDSFVHATALATVLALTVVLVVPLVVLGQPPLLLLFERFSDFDPGIMSDLAKTDTRRDNLYTLVWTVFVGILAVGYPLHRTLPAALRRVGLVVPSVGQIAFGLVFAVGLVVVMSVTDYAIQWVWEAMRWPRTDEKAFEELMRSAINPVGALVIGVTAGLGEELSIRGVLQPRLGILLSNVFFTALHAYQYNWDGLLSVFLIGLILGAVRKRTNTSTSAIVHGTYDCLLILMSYYEFDPIKWFQH
jgi:hypothetical protein